MPLPTLPPASGTDLTAEARTHVQGLTRRLALRWLGASAAVVPLASCSGGGGSAASTTTAAVTTSTTDASLASLSLSGGTLSPAFAAATLAYTATVVNSVTSITVTATVASSGATVRVNGTTVASGAASAAITLAVGSSDVTVQVTAADGSTTRSYTISVTRAAMTVGTCALIPTETVGPYPLLAVLSNSAIAREDITEGKAGVPLTLLLNLVDLNNSCTPITNASVYIWHCDKDGAYSGYSSGANGNHLGETFLRGVQQVDSAGQARFTTIYPGWYAGRITHIHFQVYLDNNLQVTATATSQLGFEDAVTRAVYASSLYSARGQNTSVASFAADNVFSDGTALQVAAVTGDVATGYVATLEVGIAR